MLLITKVTVCVFCLLAALPVEAGVLYDTQAGFVAALPPGASVVTETFDGIGVFPPDPLVLPGFSAATSGAGFFPIASGSDIWLSTNIATDLILITFSSPVSAAGGFFFPTDILGSVIPGTITVTFLASDGGATEPVDPTDPSLFLGYIPVFGGITGLTIEAVQDPGVPEGVFPTLNDLTFASVPEPGSAALIGLGLLALGGLLRRKKG